MRSSLIPKLALAIVVLGAGVAFFSIQIGQVAATPSSPQWCYAYAGGYYYNYTQAYYGYPYYYGYGNYPYNYMYYSYPYYYCSYGYNGYNYYGYNYGYDYGYNYYYSQPSKYQLTVSTDPSDLSTVSGSGTYSSGTSAAFSITQSTVQQSSNARYVFSHWSGDYSGVGASGTITMNGVRKVVAVYQLQNYLSVGVQPLSAPMPQGAGWYNAGDTATLTVAGEMLGGDSGSRLVFQGWNVDGNTVQAGMSLTVKMDTPHSVSAQYKTQYYLNVLTDQGVASGAGWYDAGSTANVYVSTPVSTNYGVSIVFNGWHGDTQSASQSATILMDGPKTAIASWRTDATVLNLTIALGIIAAFLVGAGILAYVAVSRSRYREQAVQKVPKKELIPATSEGSTSIQKKSVPPRKKHTPTEQEDDTAT